MKLLEEEAKRLGYHYVYLWTKTAVPFYEKIGYGRTQRVSLYRPCLKQLQVEEVSSLEQMLRKRASIISPENNNNKKNKSKATKETIMLPPDDNEHDKNLPDVWLRKRLVESVGSKSIGLSTRMKEMKEFIQETSNTSSEEAVCWRYILQSMPWQAQIGPSCGLSALRMVRDFYRHSEQMPSLLSEALDRGYTQDGEMFNIYHLKDLAESVCGIHCSIESAAEYKASQALRTLAEGSLIIFPYDTSPRDKLPCHRGGHSAHYGILVGLLASFSFADENGETGLLWPFSVDREEAGVSIDDAYKVFMLVQHSLSDKLSIAAWTDFISSNRQLTSMDTTKFSTDTLDLRDRLLICQGAKGD
jgi:hypothetical protein